MDSFYSGRPGKDFQIKSTFTTLAALNDDLNNPSTSPVAFNEYAIFDDSSPGKCELLQKMFAQDLDQEKDYIVSGKILGYKVIANIRGRGIEDIDSATEGDETTYTIIYTDGSTKTITIDAYDILSQSWAVGGTGARAGEDTNNSKYYSEQSANSAAAASTSENNAAAAKIASESARDLAIEARDKYPRIIDETWWIWDPTIGQNGAYVDTGTKATSTLELLGCFNTYEELKAAITDPKQGQAYGVGDYVDPESSSQEEPGAIDIYIYGYAYDTTVEPRVLKLQWINYGRLSGQEDTWILLPKKELQG